MIRRHVLSIPPRDAVITTNHRASHSCIREPSTLVSPLRRDVPANDLRCSSPRISRGNPTKACGRKRSHNAMPRNSAPNRQRTVPASGSHMASGRCHCKRWNNPGNKSRRRAPKVEHSPADPSHDFRLPAPNEARPSNIHGDKLDRRPRPSASSRLSSRPLSISERARTVASCRQADVPKFQLSPASPQRLPNPLPTKTPWNTRQS